MAREINLVPDIKEEMIKTLKLRNLIFFLCIVVAIASAVVTLIFATIAGGQQAAMDGKKETINKLSTKLNGYEDLDDFLTIRDQMGSIATLTENKQVLSRTFNVLSALMPTEGGTITISELNVGLTDGAPTLTFDAQANSDSDIDYVLLESFKKSMDYMRYDYGSYVDKEDNAIPAYCIIESGQDGAIFSDADKGLYALWTIDGEGCNPSDTLKASDYSDVESYEGDKVVRIWRTPQFKSWYRTQASTTQPQISLDGTISNVPHFQSNCITYSGDDSKNSAEPTWTETISDSCMLVPGGVEGIAISDSSNGRDSGDDLVLRFSATIMIAPEVYKFANTHVIALPPSGKHNVTDSYVQVQAMFGERAADCAEGDTACTSSTNTGGNNSNDGGNE